MSDCKQKNYRDYISKSKIEKNNCHSFVMTIERNKVEGINVESNQ